MLFKTMIFASFLAVGLLSVLGSSVDVEYSTPRTYMEYTAGEFALPEELAEDLPENNTEEEEEDVTDPNELEDNVQLLSEMDVGEWILQRSSSPRPRRAIDNGSRRRSQCNSVAYHTGSEVGHVATCPFDWVVNRENRRVPERIIEQVCRGCDHTRPCGPSHRCVQLKMRYEVFYRDTREFAQQELRAGCVCLPHDVGSTANPLLIPV